MEELDNLVEEAARLCPGLRLEMDLEKPDEGQEGTERVLLVPAADIPFPEGGTAAMKQLWRAAGGKLIPRHNAAAGKALCSRRLHAHQGLSCITQR